jgi:NDP-sugar pyrophosphorylase family protein
MSEVKEYWSDVGDYGTFLSTAQDILNQKVPGIIIPGKPDGKGWDNKSSKPKLGHPLINGRFYLGPKAVIEATARIQNSVIEAGARIAGKVEGSVIFEGAVVPETVEIINSVVHEGVVLPPVPIKIENGILSFATVRKEKVFLFAKIPYEKDTKLPKNEQPKAPSRIFFPNKK